VSEKPGSQQPPDGNVEVAARELIRLVESHLPQRCYPSEGRWRMICAAIVVRMADTLESILALMEAGLAVDGLTLIRALYEATVKFMWLAIDPEANLSAWLQDADAAARKHHDETLDYGMELLTPKQRAAVQNAKSLPPLTELAAAVDKHWEGAMLGFHEPETGEQKLLTMRGLYTMIYRTTSLTTHLQPDSLEPYIVDHTATPGVVQRAPRGEPSLFWTVAISLYSHALIVCNDQLNWPNRDRVRAINDAMYAES
jgi:hypothetical protein